MGQRRSKGLSGKGESVLSTDILYSAVSFLIIIGILVFIHELGHFLLMKRLGVGVLTFAFGFGPILFRKKVGETEYQIRSIPVGGFVKPIGEDPTEEVSDEDRARSFLVQPKWKRFLIVVAGPLFNFLLGIAIFFFVNPFSISPPPSSPVPAVVTEITPGYPAEVAGLKKGDTILSIDGKEVATWEEVAKIIRESGGRQLSIKVKRDGSPFDARVTPIASKDGEEQAYRIGIVGPRVQSAIGPKFELGNGVDRTWLVIKITVISIVKLFGGEIPVRDAIAGPLGIAQMAGQQARKGVLDLVYLIALLSVSLGFFNLFPIPILDGGHVLFLAVEAAIGKPLSVKKMEIAQQVGLILIILLMLFALYNDLIRIFSKFKF
jgi:regulator of sigma E protease